MNANELADALQETEPYYSTDYKLFDKAATMLRQQQEEIEALKSKTLTDEEIEQIGKEYGIKSVYQFAYYEFAKAILRKAQEK